eukprot:10439173-Lingulodinium_polyedra.AAC.1
MARLTAARRGPDFQANRSTQRTETRNYLAREAGHHILAHACAEYHNPLERREHVDAPNAN